MRLTQYSDYGIRVLIYLGLRQEGLTTIAEIADAYRISKNHLMKVVQRLAEAGFISSRRGKSGGLRLNRPPDRIVIGEVFRALEADFGLVECMRPGNQCVITPSCRLAAIVAKAGDRFLAVLDEYTLADVLNDPDTIEDMRRLLAIRVESYS